MIIESNDTNERKLILIKCYVKPLKTCDRRDGDQSSVLLCPARGSLARPGTNCPSGNQLTDLSASHWSAMTVTLKNL